GVPAHIAHGAPRVLLIACDQLGPRREALGAGDLAEVLAQAARGIAGLAPHHAQVADVGQGVADRGHLPVEHGREVRGGLGGEQRVAEAVVAVNDRGGSGARQVLAEPAPHALHSGDLAGLVELPQPAEAAQLALEVAGGLAEPLQAGRPPVDVVDLHQCVDQLLAYLAALLGGVEGARDARDDDLAGHQLHHGEGRADGVLLLAHRQHVRRARRQWRARWASQDDLGAAALDQVGDVGMPLPDRRGADLALADAVLVEEGPQGLEHEQRGAAVSLPVRRGLDDVVRCDRSAHGIEPYKDRNLLCAEVSQATMSKIRTLLLTLTSCALLFGAIGTGQALASHGQTTFFEGSQDLLEAKTRPRAIEQLQALGVKALRIELSWADVAPGANSATRPSFDATNPGLYAWGEYDALIAEAERLHWQVLLTVTSPVPRWATSNKKAPYVTRPDDKDFKEFMTAVARHYGSQLSFFSIWNEPNHPAFLQPQFA